MQRIGLMDVDEDSIERDLAARRLFLGFSPLIEALYEAETGRQRSRQLAYQGLAAIGVYLLFLWIDYELVPDVFMTAVAIRLGVVLLAVAVLAVLWRVPPPPLREGITSAICVVAGLSQIVIMLISQAPLRDGLQSSVVLLVFFVTLVQRLRLLYAVATCLLLQLIHAAGVLALPDLPPQQAANFLLISVCLVTMALLGLWTLENQNRRAYLLELRLRRANLTLSDISRHDPMTRLENRRALDAALVEIDRKGGKGESLAAVILDLDHFKDFNDSLGHLAGDAALRQIADLLRKSLRDNNDHAFRFGGEEFLLILPRTNLEQAARIAERLRGTIEEAGIVHPGAPKGVLTASLGVAAAEFEGPDSFGKLIADADAELYVAKNNGRNRVSPPPLAPEQAIGTPGIEAS